MGRRHHHTSPTRTEMQTDLEFANLTYFNTNEKQIRIVVSRRADNNAKKETELYFYFWCMRKNVPPNNIIETAMLLYRGHVIYRVHNGFIQYTCKPGETKKNLIGLSFFSCVFKREIVALYDICIGG